MAQNLSNTRSIADTAVQESDSATDRLAASIGISSRYIALLTAWVAMCGSLFFSEVLHWTPCVLCWYQRILMYPLAVIIAIGILRRDSRLHLYVLPFSLFGACVSLYHYLLVKTDWLPPPPCTAGIPCTVDYLDWFGFINIPFLALTAFLIISLMLVASTLYPFEDASDARATEAASYQRWAIEKAAVFAIIGLVVVVFVVGSRLV